MVGINVGGVALTVSFHELFFVSRGGKFENVDERTEVYFPTRLIVPLIIRAIYHAFAYRVSRNIHGTYSSIPFPPQSAQFPLSSFLFFPPPRPTDPLGCQVFLVQQAIVEATLSAECRPWFLSARGVREFRERNKGRLSLKNEHPCSLSWNSNGRSFSSELFSLSLSLFFFRAEKRHARMIGRVVKVTLIALTVIVIFVIESIGIDYSFRFRFILSHNIFVCLFALVLFIDRFV